MSSVRQLEVITKNPPVHCAVEMNRKGFRSRCTGKKDDTFEGQVGGSWSVRVTDTSRDRLVEITRIEWRCPCQIAEMRMKPYRPDDHPEAEVWGALYQELTTLPLARSATLLTL